MISIPIEPVARTAGRASVIQGAYGSVGNLELLACDEIDGMWVHWFNSDPVDAPPAAPDVPAGSWSAGLRFGAGFRYVDAQILQSPLGPDHLEVVALTDAGDVHSWYWSPGPGFQRRLPVVATPVSRFRASVEADGALDLSFERPGGGGARLRSPADPYPDRIWLLAESPVALDHGDASARSALLRAGVPAADIAPGSATAATSTRHGGTTELVYRGPDRRLVHVAVPA